MAWNADYAVTFVDNLAIIYGQVDDFLDFLAEIFTDQGFQPLHGTSLQLRYLYPIYVRRVPYAALTHPTDRGFA